MKKVLTFVTLCALLALGLARPLRAGWGDDPPADPKPAAQPDQRQGDKAADSKTPVVDKASWDKYEFSLPLSDGSGDLSFADLARGGRPFVLVWWLSDCPVCHMQMPYVQKLARLGDDKSVDVQVIGVNIDDNDADCNRYIRDKKLNFSVVRDPHGRATDRHYGIRDAGTPMVYVFKPGGEFAGKLSGYTRNFPERVLGMLGIPVPQQVAGNGIAIERADGTTQTRSFN